MALGIPFVPRVLGQRLEGLRVLLLGTCQIDTLASAARLCGYKTSHMLHDSHIGAAGPDVDTSQFDAAVVALTYRHIIRDSRAGGAAPSDMTLTRVSSAREAEELLERCVDLVRDRVGSLHSTLKDVPTFYLSFLEPSFNYLGNLMDRYDPASPLMFVRKLNEALSNLTREFSNCYFIDSNEIANFVGRMHLHDDVVSVSSHASFISDFGIAMDRQRLVPGQSKFLTYKTPAYSRAYGEVFWNVLADDLAIIRQGDPVKLIIVDLDDTLWRGVAAEDTVENWARTEGWPLGFIEALLIFKRRGGLLAICSKNDREPTLARLSKICRGAISVEDFVSIKINWNAKSTNVGEILAETNLLPQNVVFVDDDPREIDEVRAHYPTIRNLGSNPHDWRRIILRAPETQVRSITAESAQRTELVRSRVDREASAKTMSREEWLESLEIEQQFHLVVSKDAALFERALELLNKTNQFNTTGKRWELSELEKFFGAGGVCLLTSLKDRTVDNGAVGVALISGGELVQVVLSCRVFGLGAEIGLGRIATLISLSRAERSTGQIVDTGKNFACHKYFETIGFERENGHFVGVRACDVPQWIKITPSSDELLDRYLSR